MTGEGGAGRRGEGSGAFSGTGNEEPPPKKRKKKTTNEQTNKNPNNNDSKTHTSNRIMDP